MATFNGTDAGDILPLLPTGPLAALGDDQINGFGGNDLLIGYTGNDTLSGGTGADVLIGGVLNLVLNVGSASVSGDDTADYSSSFSGVTVDLSQVNNVSLNVLGLQLAVTGAAIGHGGDAEGDTLVGITNLTGSSSADVLTGNSDSNVLIGGAGNDVMNGRGGADVMHGNEGNDIFIVDNTGDKVFETSGQGSDTIFATGNYTLLAGQSIEFLGTTHQIDTTSVALVGNELAQTINGNDGADFLNGIGGADTMYGHKGNDVFIVHSSAEKVVEFNGEGTDTVYATASYTLGSGQSVETLATASAQDTSAIDLTGNNIANHILGNDGNNVLSGGAGTDLLFGRGGNDTIIGGADADTIDTGNGLDVVKYNAVSDSTGAHHDIILNMNIAGADRFDFTVTPTSIHAAVNVGALSAATFDHDLATAVGSSQLGAHQAVLFDPDSGDLSVAGHAFLVVDANGIAGYQAGQDYVVELVNMTGTLTMNDFM